MRQRWVYATQPFLPVGTQCVFMNRIWDQDQISDLSVGMLPTFQNNYVQDDRWVVPVDLAPGHMCNPQWLQTGEPFLNSLPPQTYAPDGWPDCCDRIPPDPAEGGLGIGGEVGDVFVPPPATGWTFVFTNTLGFDVYHLAFLLPATVPAGNVWLTFRNQVTTGSQDMFWDQASGASNVAISSFGPIVVPGESFILDGLYTNGAFDGTTNAYTIDGTTPIEVTNELTTSGGVVATAQAWFWLFAGDTPVSIQWSLGTTQFASDIASGTAT